MTAVLKNDPAKPEDKPNKKLGGRPRLTSEEKRSRKIGVPVNKEEEAQIKRLASSLNKTPAEFLRSLLLELRLPRPIPEINYFAYRALTRMGKNFNRTLVLIESGHPVGINQEFAQQILDELQRVRRLLLGAEPDGDSQNNKR